MSRPLGACSRAPSSEDSVSSALSPPPPRVSASGESADSTGRACPGGLAASRGGASASSLSPWARSPASVAPRVGVGVASADLAPFRRALSSPGKGLPAPPHAGLCCSRSLLEGWRETETVKAEADDSPSARGHGSAYSSSNLGHVSTGSRARPGHTSNKRTTWRPHVSAGPCGSASSCNQEMGLAAGGALTRGTHQGIARDSLAGDVEAPGDGRGRRSCNPPHARKHVIHQRRGPGIIDAVQVHPATNTTGLLLPHAPTWYGTGLRRGPATQEPPCQEVARKREAHCPAWTC